MNKAQSTKLASLHTIAVKTAARAAASLNYGTTTNRRLDESAEKAEAAFLKYLGSLED